MATAGEALIGNNGFTMEFIFDVVSSISQDVEDVARQGALGNFRKARSMYEEALKAHRDQFPVYAEYLRLCLDGGDWGSLVKASDVEGVAWSDVAYCIINLLRAFGRMFTNEDEQEPDDFDNVVNSTHELMGSFGHKEFTDFDSEEMLATVILLHPMRHRSFSSPYYLRAYKSQTALVFPNNRLLEMIEYSLRKGYYWVAEAVLEYYVDEDYVHGSDLHLGQATRLVSRLIRFDPQDEEQDLWAKIATMQTVCERQLNSPRETEEFQKNRQLGSIPSIIVPLRDLVDPALSRDESGEWRRSRGFIRQQLIEFDIDVMVNPAHSLRRDQALLALREVADANQDYILVSSIDERAMLLDQAQSQRRKILAFMPYKIYAKRLDGIQRASHSKPEQTLERVNPELASPIREVPKMAATPVRSQVQNLPCNTLNVENLPADTSEDELKIIFSNQRGFKRLSWRIKAGNPMCSVQFENTTYATATLEELDGYRLQNSAEEGIRLGYSKNPLGVRSGRQANDGIVRDDYYHHPRILPPGYINDGQGNFGAAFGPPSGVDRSSDNRTPLSWDQDLQAKQDGGRHVC